MVDEPRDNDLFYVMCDIMSVILCYVFMCGFALAKHLNFPLGTNKVLSFLFSSIGKANTCKNEFEWD